MPTIELSDEKVVELIQQLPPESQARVDGLLAERRQQERQAISKKLLPGVRAAAAERGKDWDAMSDAQQERFIVDLLHEDKP